MTHLSKATKLARVLLLIAVTGASPAAWAMDNLPGGPAVDVDCTDPDRKATCRECNIDGPMFCCPGAPDPCTVKNPAPAIHVVTQPTRRGLGTRAYFSR